MKTTKYFASQNFPNHQMREAVNDATSLRDTFLVENKNLIDEIDCEDIKIESNQNYAFAVIKLSYYPTKENE